MEFEEGMRMDAPIECVLPKANNSVAVQNSFQTCVIEAIILNAPTMIKVMWSIGRMLNNPKSQPLGNGHCSSLGNKSIMQ
jgi:hypothetical protein